MYIYLTMLADDHGFCHPTIDQIRRDLGLLSTTMVFESLTVLEEYGFFLRSRQTLPESRSRRNVYRRTACEYTILRLLETNRIDADMRPTSAVAEPSAESQVLLREGLGTLLEADYAKYSAARPENRREILLGILNELLKNRPNGIYC